MPEKTDQNNCEYGHFSRSVAFAFSLHLNNFNKLLVIVVLPNTKQTNGLYKQYHVKTAVLFYQKLYLFTSDFKYLYIFYNFHSIKQTF